MPTHVKVQVALAYNSLLARDMNVMDPCFRWDNLTLQDADSLANNVLDAFEAVQGAGLLPQMTAKVYDLEGTQPVLPMATVQRNTGIYRNPNRPSEISLCLSFKGGQGQPRQRGRLYVPADWIGSSSARPGSNDMTKVLGLGAQLHNVGGTNVDWIVWSRANRSATEVTSWWVDDEFDTQRRRGLRATTRVTGP